MRTTQRIITALALVATAGAGTDAWAKPGAPADVPPVVSGNVRYEVPHFVTPCTPEQNGGCVVAYDNSSNAQLWAVQIYCTKYDSDLEQDVQDVFITSLTLDGNGQLQVSNERGKHFTIDPATQKVSGDARGCGGGASGCGYATTRTGAPCLAFLVVIGLVGLVVSRGKKANPR